MKKQIPGLNGLRALSILIVIFSHVNLRNFDGALLPGVQFLEGRFGVTVFFILSGFLITTLLLKEEAANGSISLKDFYLKRSLRIFPVYFAVLLVYNLLQVCGVMQLSTASWITSLTYTKEFNWNMDWESAHFWSLSIEEQFYLFWPFVFVFMKKFRKAFAFLIVLACPLFRMLAIRYHNPLIDDYSIFQRCDAIMWGCIFALYHAPVSAFIQRVIAKYRFAILVPFLTLPALNLFTQLNLAYDLHLGVLIAPLGDLGGTISCIGVATIVIISSQYTNNAWGRLLNSRLLNYIGMLSYSLYIWQQIFFSHHIGIFSSLPLNIVLIFATALCSYYFIEKPFLSLKERLTGHKQQEAQETFMMVHKNRVISKPAYEELV